MAIEHMRVAESQQVMAVGGREKDLQIWDIATQKAVFNAKNVPNDMLSLRMPIWVRDQIFLPQSNTEVVICTGHREVRFYDTRTGKRRPQWVTKVDGTKMDVSAQCPFTAMAAAPDGNKLAIGDMMGGVTFFDLRKRQQCGVVRGGGGVRDIVWRGSTVASVGADRYMRVYNSRTRILQHKVYLKQRVNAVLMVEEASNDANATHLNESDDDEIDIETLDVNLQLTANLEGSGQPAVVPSDGEGVQDEADGEAHAEGEAGAEEEEEAETEEEEEEEEEEDEDDDDDEEEEEEEEEDFMKWVLGDQLGGQDMVSITQVPSVLPAAVPRLTFPIDSCTERRNCNQCHRCECIILCRSFIQPF
jgi:ribosome biogenesis protein NSA1